MSQKLAPALACALALVLSACAVPRPTPSADPEAAPRWYAPLPHGGTLADLNRWWQQFNDPLLLELIEAAQTASPSVATARSRLQQAQGARAIAQAALLPAADANATALRSKQPPSPIATTLTTGAQLAWEIDLFGANRLASEAAKVRLYGAEAGWHDARVTVAAETANSYLQLRTCERQLGVATRDAASRAETARLTKLTTDAGFTPPASAALARASAAEGSARLKQQRAQCDIEVKALVALSGVAEPRLRERLGMAWVEPREFAMLAVPPIPAQLVAQRPDVFAAASELAAAAADVGAARAERFPQLTLTGNIARGKAHAVGSTFDAETWSIGPLALTVPIFDGGRRAANVDIAQARYDEAVALYKARVRQAVREVEEALVNLESARARSEDAVVAVEGYRVSLTATEALYRSGLGSLIELEDQRRTVLAAETALVALQRERVASWIALYRAVGGGWTQPAAAP